MASSFRRHEVHVYLVRIDESLDRRLIHSYMALLDDGERERFDRLAGEDVRTEFLVTRALCRVMLSQFVDRPPAAWRFTANVHGKPRIASGEPGDFLEFNLSNTTGLVACAIGTGCRLGIDVESYAQTRHVEAMATRFFAASEAEYVLAAKPSERMTRFIEIWTLKEAFVKAWGSGMELPLDTFSFDTAGRRPRHRFHAESLGPEDEWRFHAWDTEPVHRIALAVGAEGADTPIGVTVRYGTPRLHDGAGWFDSPGPVRRLLLPV